MSLMIIPQMATILYRHWKKGSFTEGNNSEISHEALNHYVEKIDGQKNDACSEERILKLEVTQPGPSTSNNRTDTNFFCKLQTKKKQKTSSDSLIIARY